MTPAPVVISEVERLLYLKSLPLPRMESRTLGRLADGTRMRDLRAVHEVFCALLALDPRQVVHNRPAGALAPRAKLCSLVLPQGRPKEAAGSGACASGVRR